MDNILNYIPTILGIVSIIVGAFLVAKSQAHKTALENYKELVVSYEKKVESYEIRVNELVAEIADLKNKVAVISELPLRKMSNGIDALNNKQDIVIENQLEIMTDLGHRKK